MKIKQFEAAGLAQYSYVLSSEGVAVVIDPMRDFDRYTEYAAEEGLAIRCVTETHIHADFASSALALTEATGAELALSAYDQAPYCYSMEHRALRDGDALEIGKMLLVALHTPGHTPEHLSFVLFDQERDAAQPLALFSGDCLLVGSLGRPDLLGDGAKQELAHDLYRSLHERIASLPDGVQLYPGHGAGSLCGAGISERPESTLGFERLSQPLFKLEEEAFVREILASARPMPSYYPGMREFNSRGASSITSLPGKVPLDPAHIAALLEDKSVTVIDLRPEAFAGGHIPGALNIGGGHNLSLWAGWILTPKHRFILVHEDGDDEVSRRSLVRVGLDHVEGFARRGIAGWVDAGMEFARTTQLFTNEVVERTPDSQILDVRSERVGWRPHPRCASHCFGRVERSYDRTRETRQHHRHLRQRISIQHCLKPSSGEWVYKGQFHGGRNESLEATEVTAFHERLRTCPAPRGG